MSDERIQIVLWNYIYENCECNYIWTERAYSAFITIAGYDYQEYELDVHSAKVKLADSIFCSQRAIKWFQSIHK